MIIKETFLSKSSLETASNVSSQVPINQPQQQAQQQPQQPQQQTTTPNKPVKIHVIKTHTPPKQVNLIQRSTAIQKPKLPLTTSTASTTTSASTRTPSIAARSTSVRRQKLLENSPLKSKRADRLIEFLRIKKYKSYNKYRVILKKTFRLGL